MFKKVSNGLLAALLCAQISWASPTGLNNIPTTDVAPDRTLVAQTWLTTGGEMKPLYVTGAKYGTINRMELGIDSKVGSGKSGPVALQAKLKVFGSDFGFSALAGTEGITFDGDISENIVPYVVASQDLKISEDVQLFRLHAGYGFQKHNFSVFGGVDRSFKIWGQEFIPRSDIKQVNDGRDLLISAGFLLTLPFNLALETWLNIPTEDGAEESMTIKLDYIMKF
ncbi:MAG: hypothetical protein ACE5JK_00010 [Candidatus Omnitrophota bacterium]